jgi:DNA adenine methylase
MLLGDAAATARSDDADPHVGNGEEVLTAGVGDGRSTKPFDSYPGSKDAAGAAETIIGLFHPHSVYVEPFVGNGAVVRKKQPALRTIVCDRDYEVVEAWRRFNMPGVELHWGCGICWMLMYGGDLPADALVYCDPPYLMETRSGKRLYRYEMTAEQHGYLLDAAERLPCTVFISGYDSALYRERLAGWAHTSFPAMTRGGLRTEHLWWRSSLASFGGDPRYAGKGFRERERIKRKAPGRWAVKFRKLPPAERVAVLAAVLAVNGEGADGIVRSGVAAEEVTP